MYTTSKTFTQTTNIIFLPIHQSSLIKTFNIYMIVLENYSNYNSNILAVIQIKVKNVITDLNNAMKHTSRKFFISVWYFHLWGWLLWSKYRICICNMYVFLAIYCITLPYSANVNCIHKLCWILHKYLLFIKMRLDQEFVMCYY